MIPIGDPQFRFSVVGPQRLTQGDRASPEEEAVVLSDRQTGGWQILGLGDVLGDEGEDVLFVEEFRIEGVPEAPEK